jgi:diguanylate cyclase (GGDEF)-like protein/PAS domain S-box-containing protein
MRRGALLIVDDNELNRDSLSRRLIRQGYLVETAADGEAALARAAAADLVLLDVEMPGLSGLEVLSVLRQTHSQTALPVIMVTARTHGDDIVEAFRLGANDYVTKPIDFPVALARIRTHLSHKWAVEALRDSEERYALALQGANDGLWDWNLETGEVYWSPRWKAMLGCDEVDLGASPDEWLARIHEEDVEAVRAALEAHLSGGTLHFDSEHRVRHRDGTYRWVRSRGAAVCGPEGVRTRLVGSLTDVTDSKVADGLTGLPNRLLFVDLLGRAIRRAARRREYVFALLVLGLDRFKTVTESLGPLNADRLLVAVAHRLQASLRATDAITHDEPGCTLARLSGDEFTVLIDDIGDANDAVRVAERLRGALERPFEVDGRQIFTSAAVGITLSTTGYERAEEALHDAAIALQRAKARGGRSCELFDPIMRERAVTRLQIETDLRQAIDRQAFTVVYQPIVSLRSGVIVGFESLARWPHPARGLLAPDAFISIAEATGLIGHIGHQVLEQSCRQMLDWQRRFGPGAPALMCVNVSGSQIARPELADEIARVLADTGLPPASLKLEITESAFIADVEAAEATLARVRAMGVEWSVDDFGTGYSSLSYLHRLQAHTVKIDRSFVSRIGVDDKGTGMVRAIVALAANLGMDVVAEGVETHEQCAALRALGCDLAQGFLFSKPVEAEAAQELIRLQPWKAANATAKRVIPSGLPVRSALA